MTSSFAVLVSHEAAILSSRMRTELSQLFGFGLMLTLVPQRRNSGSGDVSLVVDDMVKDDFPLTSSPKHTSSSSIADNCIGFIFRSIGDGQVLQFEVN